MIKIDLGDKTSEAVAFLVDGKHFVSGGLDGRLRRLRVEDGKEVGPPMEVGDAVCDISVSQDGRWIASGTIGDGVTVWNAESHEKVPIKLKTDVGLVFAIDVSPDGTKIATGSAGLTACVFSLSTGERVLGPLEHDNVVVGIKFSPDGRLIATATEDHHNSVRIYDGHDGSLLVDFPIIISDTASNKSLAWAGDSKQLFALSRDGNINRLDVTTGTIQSHWLVHSYYPPLSIALASNGTFIAAAAGTSVSFWDTTSYERIGSVIEHEAPVASMAISANYDIVTSTGSTVTLAGLGNVLPPLYCDTMVPSGGGESSPMKIEGVNLEDITKPPRAHDKLSNSKIAELEQEIARIKGENAELKDTVESLLADIRDLRARNEGSDKRISRLEAVIQERFPTI